MFKVIMEQFFPQQTKSIPALLLWFFIFFFDGWLVLFVLSKLAPELMGWLHWRTKTFVIVALTCGLWMLEAWIYNRIRALFE